MNQYIFYVTAAYGVAGFSVSSLIFFMILDYRASCRAGLGMEKEEKNPLSKEIGHDL